MSTLTLILPFFDETAYLRQALTSVFCQGIGDLQVIVVNDNPEAFEAAQIHALAGPYPIELIEHPRNLGLSAARNTGLGAATGQYIGFLDSDDYYTLTGLSNHLRVAEANGADITHAPTYFTRQGQPKPQLLPRDDAFFMQARAGRGLRQFEEAQFITSSWSSLYRRDFLDRHDLHFDPEQTRFEDRLFVLQTVTRAASMAFTGRATRIWRGRTGSISVSPTTPDTHVLQIQLLEKCMAHIKAETDSARLPLRFYKRELFNTVSRLIWDLDVIDAIHTNDDPTYRDLARRIPALLGADSFGQPIFDDPVLRPISRVGMRTRKGRITRAAFFEMHRALREGDFGAALSQREACALSTAKPAAPKRAARRLVLHIGLHKTGTTYIQHHLQAHRAALLKRGVLVPQTGLSAPEAPLRAGALPGHQGLVGALRRDDPVVWAQLGQEIRTSRADTVVLSCENMAFPTAPDRGVLIARLMARLSGFDEVDVVALLRRPDAYVEQFYREWVADNAPMGAQPIQAFLVDHGASLLDLPALLAPFEGAGPVRLGDFDAMRGAALWPEFARLAGLPADLAVCDVARYPTPDRTSIQLIRALHALVPDSPRRAALMRAYFALPKSQTPDTSLLSPDHRATLLRDWQQRSGAFAAQRGYAPDLTLAQSQLSAEIWTPPAEIAAEALQTLTDLATTMERPGKSAPLPPVPTRTPKGPSVTIRLRPWVAQLLARVTRR
ncbi:MAG: glycosyltransferase [Sedimentitalea sp.]